MEQQIIPTGYKQTEVGVIPNDWKTPELGEICKLINGRGFKPFEWDIEGLPIIRIQNLNGSDDFNYYSGKFDPKILIEQNQLLFAWSGSRGTSFGPHIWKGNKALLNYHTWKMVVNDAKVVGGYFYHALKKLTVLIEDSAHGASALVHTQMGDMNKFLVPLPQKEEEQTAIAKALSDVDALIASIEKLIVKKQAIKTATMQQLLTGKKRIPPFDKYQKDGQDGTRKGQSKGTQQSEFGEIPEDWEVINFGELFEINVSRKKVRLDSLVSFVGMQDVSENAKLVSPSLLRYEKVKSGFTYFERSDVLVAKITPCFENGKGCYTEHLPTPIGFGSTEFHVLRATTSSFAKYIYFITVTQKFRNELESEMVGSAGHRRVPFSALKNYQIPATRNKEEQIAIANILTDMDEEIQAFEQRLTKTQKIKQGMMQELLTGKTRLPVTKIGGTNK
jgi:type I restriction enzyme S subunit